jgi:hypothetical protein
MDEYKYFDSDDLMLLPDATRKKYEKGRKEKKSIGWGQRKLLMSEIEFFTIYWNPEEISNPHCVYAGAASGEHILILSDMFPNFTFDLYDPRKEAFNINETDKIKIIPEYFTNETAERYKDRSDVFFLSDIRTADYIENQKNIAKKYGLVITYNNLNKINEVLPEKIQREMDSLTDEQIFKDMLMQQDWIKIMNPEHALIKFRLPYYQGYDFKDLNVSYLKGVVYWQIWQPPTSTETRLKPIRNKDTKKYEEGNWNIQEYEEWCYNHNVYTREKVMFKNIFTNTNEPITEDLLNDYDSMSETMILKLYCDKFCAYNDNKLEMVSSLSNKITKILNTDPMTNKYQNISLNDIRKSGLIKRSLYVKNVNKPKTKNIILSENMLVEDGYETSFDFSNQITDNPNVFKLC